MTTQTEFEYTDLKGFVSTAIDIAAYNVETKKLFIRFTNGGEIVYQDVSFDTWKEFIDAQSAGRYYNYYIQGRYVGTIGDFDLIIADQNAEYSADAEVFEETNDVSTQPVEPAVGKYGVRWSHGMFTLEVGYEATSEEEALRTFTEEIEKTIDEELPGSDYKILAVTHYFE